MSEVKEEGTFKIKKKPKLKNMEQPEVIKVDLANPPKKEEDAVQEQITDDSNDIVGQPEDATNSEKVVEEVRDAVEEKEENVIEEISDEATGSTERTVEGSDESATTLQDKEAILQEAQAQAQLPENVDSLVKFMNETGGSIEDYVRLNADYSNIDSNMLLREYYKQSKPHLDAEDVSILMEDFTYDEDVDDDKEIRKKKIAYKEEVAKAKTFLNSLKDNYYKEVKSRPGVSANDQKAIDFFNRYNQQQETAQKQHEDFITKSNEIFSNEFKGFEFNLGEKKVNYKLSNPKSVAETQSNIANIVGKFLNEDGSVKDPVGYHKAMYAARNADTLIKQFYEQGKADAIKEIEAKSKNISGEARKSLSGQDVFVNGIKVKVINGVDSSKLKIKKKI